MLNIKICTTKVRTNVKRLPEYENNSRKSHLTMDSMAN